MRTIYAFLVLLLLPFSLLAQDDEDLLSILGEEETTEYAEAAFKSNRVIHGHSMESTAHGVMDFKISHRFGMLNTGIVELFGLDNAMIRIGLDLSLIHI